ncbi:MAG: helix-turn-helix transcriptional regulator [Lachnospiraceae bacterium]|nr:helix-turn-helix transcriptional regulator [Lachnospiraceae bacterium]
MDLKELLEEKDMSVMDCSKVSGVPYSTLMDLVKKKTRLEKSSGETLYKLAKVLNVSMEELIEEEILAKERADFENFKSNMCHQVKSKGDLDFIVDTLQNDEVSKYWRLKWYKEAYYTLAMVDYLSRINDLPICTNYNDIRETSLKEPVYPRDIIVLEKFEVDSEACKKAYEEAIPEFKRFNIIEGDIRDVC